MKISSLKGLLEKHLPLVKKVMLLIVAFWIGVFVLTIVLALIIYLFNIQGYNDWLDSLALLTLYAYSNGVWLPLVILSIILVYGKWKKIPKLYLVKAEIAILVLAILPLVGIVIFSVLRY